MWKEVLKEKYGSEIGNPSEGAEYNMPSYASKWWKDIMKMDRGGDGSWFNEEGSRKVNNGNTTSFWWTKWRGFTTLKDKYSRLFSISNQKEAKIAEIWLDRGTDSGWNFIWRRGLFVWEEEMFNNLLLDLQGFACTLGEDVWRWKLEGEGDFTVKSMYKKLELLSSGEEGRGEEDNQVLGQIWKSGAPSRVVALAWKGLLNRIPTRDNLAWRNVMPIGANFNCVLCNETEEIVNHLFLHCAVSWKIWVAILTWIDVNLIIPADLFMHWKWWDGLLCNRKENKRGMRIIWQTSLWVIWKARNNIIFNNGVLDMEAAIDEIKMLSWKWSIARLRMYPCLYYEWRWDPKWCMANLRG